VYNINGKLYTPNEMVVFAGDINGHVGSSDVGYDGTHGGFGYGSRNADGSRILEFADWLNIVICNTLFTKQEAKLVTYVAGPVKSTVDYIMMMMILLVWQPIGWINYKQSTV